MTENSLAVLENFKIRRHYGEESNNAIEVLFKGESCG